MELRNGKKMKQNTAACIGGALAYHVVAKFGFSLLRYNILYQNEAQVLLKLKKKLLV